MRNNFHLLIEHHSLTLLIKIISTKGKNESDIKSPVPGENTMHKTVTIHTKLCAQVWNRHIKISFKNYFSLMLP
jgi:hypothetical protein